MMTKRKEERLRAQAQQTGTESEVLLAVVSPGHMTPHVEVQDRNRVACLHEYSRACIGADGVARVMLPGGKVVEYRDGCPACRKVKEQG